MNLKSFGCSFIFGSELNDCPDRQETVFSQYTWPALVAKQLELDYKCYASPGAGNLRIAESVLNETVDSSNSLYVISWTWIDRFDYVHPLINKWQTILPADQTDLAEIYYKNLHTQYKDKLSTLLNIKLTIDYLKQHNCRFVMTYMDELMFETEWHSSAVVADLQNYIYPHMTKFDGLTFLDWSHKHNYAISEKWHPLEEAHFAASELIGKIVHDRLDSL